MQVLMSHHTTISCTAGIVVPGATIIVPDIIVPGIQLLYRDIMCIIQAPRK